MNAHSQQKKNYMRTFVNSTPSVVTFTQQVRSSSVGVCVRACKCVRMCVCVRASVYACVRGGVHTVQIT